MVTQLLDSQRSAFTAAFQKRLPDRPYCANDYTYGVKIRRAELAVNYQHVQPNAPWLTRYIVIDIDSPDAASRWIDAGAEPSYMAINNDNGHGHIFYEIEEPVEHKHIRAEQFLRDVTLKATLALGGDRSFKGNLAKNPVHPKWRTYASGKTWTLNTLNDALTMSCDVERMIKQAMKEDRRKRRESEITDVFGVSVGERNESVFRATLRNVYYRVKLAEDVESFRSLVEGETKRLNGQLVEPLGEREVVGIAKSAARWVWKVRHAIATREDQTSELRAKGGRVVAAARRDATVALIEAHAGEAVHNGRLVIARLAKLIKRSVRTLNRYRGCISAIAERMGVRYGVQKAVLMSSVEVVQRYQPDIDALETRTYASRLQDLSPVDVLPPSCDRGDARNGSTLVYGRDAVLEDLDRVDATIESDDATLRDASNAKMLVRSSDASEESDGIYSIYESDEDTYMDDGEYTHMSERTHMSVHVSPAPETYMGCRVRSQAPSHTELRQMAGSHMLLHRLGRWHHTRVYAFANNDGSDGAVAIFNDGSVTDLLDDDSSGYLPASAQGEPIPWSESVFRPAFRLVGQRNASNDYPRWMDEPTPEQIAYSEYMAEVGGWDR